MKLFFRSISFLFSIIVALPLTASGREFIVQPVSKDDPQVTFSVECDSFSESGFITYMIFMSTPIIVSLPLTPATTSYGSSSLLDVVLPSAATAVEIPVSSAAAPVPEQESANLRIHIISQGAAISSATPTLPGLIPSHSVPDRLALRTILSPAASPGVAVSSPVITAKAAIPAPSSVPAPAVDISTGTQKVSIAPVSEVKTDKTHERTVTAGRMQRPEPRTTHIVAHGETLPAGGGGGMEGSGGRAPAGGAGGR